MPHINAVKNLEAYGNKAVRLSLLSDLVDENYLDDSSWKMHLQNFIEYFNSNDLKDLVIALANDKYAFNRELAALSVQYLWMGWKIIPYNDTSGVESYDQSINTYTRTLSWTMPVIEKLLQDKCVGPRDLAIICAREMEYSSKSEKHSMRSLLLNLYEKVNVEQKQLIITNYIYLYPSNNAGKRVIDNNGMKILRNASESNDINLSNRAKFILDKLVITNTKTKLIENRI